MLPFKRILCPTDFSEPSYEALKAAVELAENFSAELVIVHVVSTVPVVAVSPIVGDFDVALYQKELETDKDKKLKEVINQMVPEGLKVSPVIVTGNSAEIIVQTAAKQKADLIVIATHGETGFRHLIFGSVAEKVVRMSSVPVLTIHMPEKAKAGRPDPA